MKKKILKKSIIIALLASFCIAPFASCNDDSASLSVGTGLNNTEQTSDPVTAPKYYTMPEEFRLVAYGTPPTTTVSEQDTGAGKWAGDYDENNAENWRTMKDCGFDWAQPIYYEDEDADYILSLSNADAINKANPDEKPIKVLITNYDYRQPTSLAAVTRMKGTYAEAMEAILAMEDKLKERYDAFAAYDSFGGIFGADEPSADMFPSIAAAQDWFEWNYPDYEFYINLFPEYASPTQLFGTLANTDGYAGLTGQAAYNKYISEFCKEVTPYMISYDHYCLTTTQTIPGFVYNLAAAATQAKKLEDESGYETPFFVYLQSMGFEGKMKIDNYERWAWQCYTSMAFGVTGIQAFCYWTLLAESDGTNIIEDGIVDRNGKPTDLYSIVQRTNQDIKDLESIYMSYNWEGAKGWYNGQVSGTMSELNKSGLETADYEDISAVKITSGSNDNREFLIGQFASRANSSKKAYMVTNSSEVNFDYQLYYDPGQIDLTFDNGITQVDVYKPGKGGVAERIPLTNGVLSLSIPTGEGFFVVPVTE